MTFSAPTVGQTPEQLPWELRGSRIHREVSPRPDNQPDTRIHSLMTLPIRPVPYEPATVEPRLSHRRRYARPRARHPDRSDPGGPGHAAGCVALRLVDDHVLGHRGLHLHGGGRALPVVRRPGRAVALVDGLVQRAGELGRPPRVQPRRAVDGDGATPATSS